MYDKFEGDFPKLSKSNSLAVGSSIIYIKKIGKSYIAWDYKTRIKVVATDSKERLIDYLNINKNKLEERLCQTKK